MGLAPLDVDLLMLPKELDEKVAEFALSSTRYGAFTFWSSRGFRLVSPVRGSPGTKKSELRAHQMAPGGLFSH